MGRTGTNALDRSSLTRRSLPLGKSLTHSVRLCVVWVGLRPLIVFFFSLVLLFSLFSFLKPRFPSWPMLAFVSMATLRYGTCRYSCATRDRCRLAGHRVPFLFFRFWNGFADRPISVSAVPYRLSPRCAPGGSLHFRTGTNLRYCVLCTRFLRPSYMPFPVLSPASITFASRSLLAYPLAPSAMYRIFHCPSFTFLIPPSSIPRLSAFLVPLPLPRFALLTFAPLASSTHSTKREHEQMGSYLPSSMKEMWDPQRDFASLTLPSGGVRTVVGLSS